ncbi:MAG: 50S ribosomal protein L20 [Patescibacteria group bacterium]|nr:MAG: 50S ribosomal protein L20 [Patescibacteria group bacterium]
MVRVKSLSSKKHKKILKQAKGYRMTRRKLFKKAMEAVLHAGEYAFAGRKQKKRQFRSLWILRINNAVRELGGKYSNFIHNLKEKNIQIDRKILAKLAVDHPQFFKQVFDKASKK